MTAAPVCVLCGGALTRVYEGLFDTRFGAPGKYDVGRCSACGCEQLMPPPDQETLNRLYDAHYNFDGSGGRYAKLRDGLLRSGLGRLWTWIDGDVSFQTASGSGRLLDIGCNEGRNLARFAERGFHAEGLETNAVAAEAARRRGLTVHTQPLETFEPQEGYDVIVLSNVLEHFLDPGAMLEHVARLLRPGGQVWISCPNGRSAMRALFGRNWINWHIPYHIVQFTRTTLSAQLEARRLSVVSARDVSPALWVAQSIACIGACEGAPTRRLRSVPLMVPLVLAIRLLFWPALYVVNRLGRGDCLVVRAVKAG